MDPQSLETLLIIMAVFVAVSATALVIQASMLYGLYKSSRAMQAKFDALAPKIEALAETSRAAVDENRVRIGEIAAKATDILDVTRRQLERIEGLVENASERAQVQFDRAEMVIDDAMGRAQETVAVVHQGIMVPIREIHGVVAGLKAALQYFFRGGRPDPDQVTVDDEMFI